MTTEHSYSNEELSQEIKAVQKALAEIRRMLYRLTNDKKKARPEVGYR